MRMQPYRLQHRIVSLFGMMIWLLTPVPTAKGDTELSVITNASPVLKKTLIISGDRDYPPYCYLDNGIPTGFDIDVIREVARTMNIELAFDLKPWSEARELLRDGAVDVIPGMARIPSRESDFDFSTPTKQLMFDLFVRKDSPIHTLEDARHLNILVQKAGVMDDLIRQQNVITNITPVPDASEAIQLLDDEKYDGAIVNRVQGHYILAHKKINSIKSLKITLPTIPYCLAVKKGETDLIDRLNEGLIIMKAEGRYDEIYEKWFGIYEKDFHSRTVNTILIVTGIIFLLLIISGLISWSLRKKVQSRTAELRQVIDSIPFLIFARDRQGRYTLANQATAQSMGISINEIIGRRHQDLFPNDTNTTTYLQEDQDVFSSNQSRFIPETEYIDRDGRRHVVQVTKIPFRQIDNHPTSVLCGVIDITDLKEAEEAVRSSRENLMITLNSIADGVIATDANGHIISVNPVAEKLTGYQAREAVGRSLASVLNFITTEGEALAIGEITRQALFDEQNTSLGLQVTLISRDGSQRDVSVNWSPIRRADGTHTGLVLVLRDVTEENRLTHRLNETQKMESIGRLAGGVAHDFNNLLAGIIGYAELLNHSLGEQNENRTYLRGIFEASERARDLVQQLLAFSRRSPREIKPQNMHTIIGHVISLMQHTTDRRITISRHLNASLCTVMGDRTQLQNALLNLGINARDAMPSGGSLTVTSRNMQISEAECDHHPYPIKPGPFIELSITDTGIGMDRETLSHIFEPFYTTKGKMGGTGLGLAAVYGTIKDHGGYIDVFSKPGMGTTFKLGFPVIESAEATEEEHAEHAQSPAVGCILIVDDEDIVLRTVNEILQSLGYRTLTAVNGRQALEIYKNNFHTIDLVLLDMIMPELNGEETFREMKKINADIKAIISSGYMQDYGFEALSELGVIDVLQKPFRKHDLATKVANGIRHKSPPA